MASSAAVLSGCRQSGEVGRSLGVRELIKHHDIILCQPPKHLLCHVSAFMLNILHTAVACGFRLAGKRCRDTNLQLQREI